MENVTLTQALQTTYTILQGISVPIGLMQQIALPIMTAMENINNCIEALNEQKQAPAQEEAPKADEFEPDPNEEKAFGEEEI